MVVGKCGRGVLASARLPLFPWGCGGRQRVRLQAQQRLAAHVARLGRCLFSADSADLKLIRLVSYQTNGTNRWTRSA